jgi:hypothetical protein
MQCWASDTITQMYLGTHLPRRIWVPIWVVSITRVPTQAFARVYLGT